MDLIINIIGWVGTFIIVLMYLLSSNDKIEPESITYQSLNLLGAIFVGVNVFHQQAWPALGLQIIWGLISIVMIIKAIKPRKI